MHKRRPFFKQKPILYFDENFPQQVIQYFRSAYWGKKIRVTSALAEGHLGKSDPFHYSHCKRNGYTLVTLDLDFNNDRLYPFAHGMMPGIIMLKASSSDSRRLIFLLSRLLGFVITVRFPKGFMTESKFVLALDGVLMRGRSALTKEIKTLQIRAGITKIGEVIEFFDY